MKYPVTVHKSKYGYDVHCPLLRGCHSQGDTLKEALQNIKDAIKTYLQMINTNALNIVSLRGLLFRPKQSFKRLLRREKNFY